MAEKKELTPLQQKYLAVLFDEAKGDHRKAMRLAGYSDHVRVYEVTRSLKDEILTALKDSLVTTGPKAAYGLYQAFEENPSPGQRDRTAAAIAIFDRIGLVKAEQVEVKGPTGGIFILPPKETPETEPESD